MPPRAMPTLPRDRTPVPIDVVREYLSSGPAGLPSYLGAVLENALHGTRSSRMARSSDAQEEAASRFARRIDESDAARACIEALRACVSTHWPECTCRVLRFYAKKARRGDGEFAVALLAKHERGAALNAGFALADAFRWVEDLGVRVPRPTHPRDDHATLFLSLPGIAAAAFATLRTHARALPMLADDADDVLEAWVAHWNQIQEEK